MTRFIWGDVRPFEAGVDRGVLFPQNSPGVVWNGLTQVKEAPSDGDAIAVYVDGFPFRNSRQSEGFAGTIEAFTYPDEFLEYDGFQDQVITQQRRKTFGFSYRVMSSGGPEYKIHIVYNAVAKPSNRDWQSLSNSVQPLALSWDFESTPVRVPGSAASSHLIIDSSVAHPSALTALEDALYGTDATDSTLPSLLDVIEIFESNAILRIIDNGDGTWTAIADDSTGIITMLSTDIFEIDYVTAVFIDTKTYTISSL